MLDGAKEIVIKRLNHKIGWGKNLDERCDRATDDVAKKRLEHCSDRNDAYIFGAETVLEDMGYWLEKDDDGIITDICSVMIHQYRVRYRMPNSVINAAVCNSNKEVQDIVDRIKEADGYSLVGLDERECEAHTVGLTGEWNKIFDF